MKIRLWILTTVAVTLLAGCSRATPTTSAGDCEILVKTAQHGTYRTLGIYAPNDSLDPPIDTALLSVCEDTGRDARGPVFNADSPSTQVSPVPGVAPAKA